MIPKNVRNFLPICECPFSQLIPGRQRQGLLLVVQQLMATRRGLWGLEVTLCGFLACAPCFLSILAHRDLSLGIAGK